VSENYDDMPAGREADAAVARVVFGWRWAHARLGDNRPRFALVPPKGVSWEPSPDGPGIWTRQAADFVAPEASRFRDWDRACVQVLADGKMESGMPEWTRDLAAAWQVVEAMHTKGELFGIVWKAGVFFRGTDEDLGRLGWEAEFRRTGAFGASESAPLAICIAALKAVDKLAMKALTVPA
jgi:hypothetical protein